MTAAGDLPTLDLARAQATLGTDETGRTTLVITDGQVEVVLVAGEDRRAALRGTARLRTALSGYQEHLMSGHRPSALAANGVALERMGGDS